MSNIPFFTPYWLLSSNCSMYGRMRTAQSLHSLLPIKLTPQCANVKFTDGELSVCDMVMVRRNADLFEVVAALGAAGKSTAIRMATIAMTTRSSNSAKLCRGLDQGDRKGTLQRAISRSC